MKKLILFLFFWNIVVEITLAQSGYGKISGTITDIRGQALLGVAVGLILPSDSSTVKSTISDENGRFVIQHIPNNTYLLVCSYLGYETYKTVPLKIDSYHTSIALPMIVMLKKNILLKEVSVTASKPLIQHKTDRTIVNVDAMGTAAGSNILEVIDKSPGVMTDVNGDITLNGKGSVLVLIDERPTYLSAQELSGYLGSIPAGVVERIELISNPSARYDAANGAIINIVLKKNKIEGFNGNLDLGYNQGYYSRINDVLNLNYRKNKVSVFSNLSFNRSRNFNEETLHRSFYNPDKSLESEIVSDKRYSYLSNGLSVRLGTDYFASPKTTIGFLLAGTTRPKNDQQTFSGMQTDSNLRPENTTDGFSDGSYKWKSGGINFNFKHRFDTTGTTLSADLDYIIYKSDGNQTLTDREKYTDSSNYSSHTILYDLPSQINIYAVKTDFTHPFNSSSRFDAGLKNSLVRTNNSTNQFNLMGEDFVPYYRNFDHFIYLENINAAYASLSKEWGKWAIQSGLRVENTIAYGHLLGNTEVRDSDFHKSYTHFFPDLYLTYHMDPQKLQTLTLSYNKRIRRPNYQQLNPFLLEQDQYTYTAGNPYLLPHLIHNISVKYSFKSIFEITLDYSYINRLIQTLTQGSGDSMITKPENFGTNYSYNLIPYLSLHPVRFWNLQISGILFYLVNKGDAFGQMIENKAISGEVEVNNHFMLGKGWEMELYGFYASEHLGGQSVADPFWKADASLRKKISNKAAIRLKVDDIFHTLKLHQTILGLPDQSASRIGFSDTRVIGLSFDYKFGNQGSTKKRNHTNGGAEDEKSRVD